MLDHLRRPVSVQVDDDALRGEDLRGKRLSAGIEELKTCIDGPAHIRVRRRRGIRPWLSERKTAFVIPRDQVVNAITGTAQLRDGKMELRLRELLKLHDVEPLHPL